ncbi:protein of unknown function [Bradyrhizobium sp. Rc3b]|uniref:DUF4145 domain-containing protein n=1 Tax=Bradyrhizobium sp. Rc3b TaxID=1855322 RepID=UPI0008F16289|nr:DUF4145 domain-containing protein [Bradyrhizobium sp. Rc3b]SFM50652.1 protein of unknown function [Bradyrhizobium sp. Rc3b]
MAEVERKIKAPCSTCIRETTHTVLFETTQTDGDFNYAYVMISCGGCQTISMGVQTRYLSDGSLTNEYYPSPVSRQQPRWLQYMRLGLDDTEETIGDLIFEVYRAVDAKQYRLAAMGIRAALEQIMIFKTGDHGTFQKNLDAFQSAGLISVIQRDAMRATLDVGDAAMHRGYTPKEKDLRIALDVLDGVCAPIFGHGDEAKSMGKRVPPRK